MVGVDVELCAPERASEGAVRVDLDRMGRARSVCELAMLDRTAELLRQMLEERSASGDVERLGAARMASRGIPVAIA